MKECRYYQRLDDGTVECLLCPHHCRIANGRTGRCGSRRNHDGVLVSEVYAKPCALAIDPVEKKPLYHFHPGTTCLSIACTGCNFRCLNCQNHDISQAKPEEVNHYELTPEDIVALCLKHRCPGIAYTYTEPLTYIEYITDTARLAHEAGLWNILVTAGYVCQEPLAEFLPYLDAANIDLKSFSDDIYQHVSGGHLQPVLDTILAMRDAGVWIELTNLVIPGVNDDMQMIRQMCRWIADNGLADNPLHFSRFFPRYKLQNISPTPVKTLKEAQRIALEEGIKHVYLGNV
ncbi:MAG: AmmeMemoRadiSam system radical SAM enzyme [Prevotella sp.]|nr:AmmeMemoRadiSam system radical SAM enzyme [Prevotella sp.]MBR6190326.1 AmmeMemoRadiSam system radical SAM enzyme [Prevotella sp.]